MSIEDQISENEDQISENAEDIRVLSRIVYMLAEGREIAASDLPSGWWGKVLGEEDAYAEAYTSWGSTSTIIHRRQRNCPWLNGERVVIVPESAVPEWARKQGV